MDFMLALSMGSSTGGGAHRHIAPAAVAQDFLAIFDSKSPEFNMVVGIRLDQAAERRLRAM